VLQPAGKLLAGASNGSSKSLAPSPSVALTQNYVYAILYIQMLFSWDERKNRSNRRNHGISFDTAARVFLDPFHMSRQDRIVDGEGRWQTIGLVNGLLILVAHTVVDEEDEIIRII
jgi:uncharacterized protein